MFNNQFIVITTVVHPILPRIFADPGLGSPAVKLLQTWRCILQTILPHKMPVQLLDFRL